MMINNRYFLVFSLGTLIATSPLHAMDVDNFDATQNNRQSINKKESTSLENTVEEYRKKIGIKAPVYVETCSDTATSGEMVTTEKEHTVTLPLTLYTLLENSSIRNVGYYVALYVLCHEMGHAKQNESPYFKERETAIAKKIIFQEVSSKRLSEEMFQNQYERELAADETVPNEKMLLSGAKNFFYQVHRLFVEEIKASRIKQLRIKLCLRSFSIPPLTEIDFSLPMNEEHAKTWDKIHREWLGDKHPSHYRRAYQFNERLKKLEAQEEMEKVQ
jgi:hypothetical protein